ncbi:beat protein [Nesidiocoris tenuis]|uniref:Beat protein n=1 Tax=Nesidiocoris tenuis TaxID=355587 RepID=A0ABN7ATE3_9HEMI|nr:beat protein [Nesidiocoris tenuis]
MMKGWVRGYSAVPFLQYVTGYGTIKRGSSVCVQYLCPQGNKRKIETTKELSDGLKLIDVKIDKHVVMGRGTTLECLFDMESEPLYSVKWYKDGHEFFRFVPKEVPPSQHFSVPGVHVDLENSTEAQVRLTHLELKSSGKYRCEVSAEGPSFQTVSAHSDMLVVALPEKGPTITGGRPRYQVGEHVNLNCTSGPSQPPTHLQWYINGAPANATLLRGPHTRRDASGLEVTTLGLEFRVERRHYRKGDMKLKCLASIATVYWNSNEESVEGDRPQRPPALEVKDNLPYPSRADRVLVSTVNSGVYSQSNLLHLLSILILATLRS